MGNRNRGKGEKRNEENLEPMTFESFYARIEGSEKALERGEIITQDDLREEMQFDF